MRKFKFRAWDKDRECFLKCIIGNTDMENAGWICPLTYCDVNGEYDWYHNGTCAIMQYTGLKDRNGVEIYEGDIVKFEDVGEEGYEYKEAFDFTNRACVCWNNGRFELEKIVYDNSAMLEYMYNSHEEFINEFKGFEVIGNVYENPELLEQ